MPDQPVSSLLAQATRPLLSFELFPPKDEAAFDRLWDTVASLKVVRPDFVTVTYGAGGTTRDRSLEVCHLLRGAGFAPVVPHLTCVGANRTELDEVVETFYGFGYRTIMALRGDPPRGAATFTPYPDGLPYARDLVEQIKTRRPDICCGVAGYPETHPEAASPASDLQNLVRKVEAGGSFITTQLFYENRRFFEFVERCRKAGIHVPILPGLLPAVSLKQVRRITAMCNADLPERLARQLEATCEDPEGAAEVGIRWVAGQIKELLERGVPGIHLYILNRAKTGLAPAILEHFGRYRA